MEWPLSVSLLLINKHSVIFLKKDFIYLLFLEREREGERERNINVLLPLVHPLLGTWHVPSLGIEPVTLWFVGWHSIY